MPEDHLYENIASHFLNMQRLSAPRDLTLKAMQIGLRNAEVFLGYSENIFCFLFLIILTLTGQTGWQQAVSYACSRTISSTRKRRYWSKGIEVTEGSLCEGK